MTDPLAMLSSALRAGLLADSDANRHRLATMACYAIDHARENAWEFFRRLVARGSWCGIPYDYEDRASRLLARARADGWRPE